MSVMCARAESLLVDFESGLPETFTYIDNDGNTPAPDTESSGFDKGVAWTSIYLSEEKNRVACSTSWYSPAGTSDDWMILPPLKVDNEKTRLKWKAKASDPYMSDGYSVYVSAGGNSIADFTAIQPVFSVESESDEWTAHELDLSPYAGKEISIAIVNNSTDCAFLYVDDISVGSPRALCTRPAMSTIARPGEDISLKAFVHTELDTAVDGFRLRLKVDDDVYDIDCADVRIEPGEETEVALNVDVTLGAGEVRHCVLESEAGGEKNETEFDLTAFELTRVAEEFTGTWCGFCVRGIAGIQAMNEKYPDSFIAIAMHCGGEEADPMDTHNCIDGLPAWGFEGYPYSIMNRRKEYNGDPQNMQIWYESLGLEAVKAGLKVSAEESNGEISVSADVWFAEDEEYANYNMVYTVIENDVHQPGNGRYSQRNEYAGGSRGEMGGFEDLPAVIDSDDMWHQHVARWSFESAKGVEGMIPTRLCAGVPVSTSYRFKLPQNVLVPENTECCVLLINSLNDQIINASKISLRDVVGSGVNDAVSGSSEEVARYSIDGNIVTEDYKGIVIIRMSDGSVIKSMSR